MAVHDEICRSIDRFKERAIGLGRQIHAHPELKFESASRPGCSPARSASRRPTRRPTCRPTWAT